MNNYGVVYRLSSLTDGFRWPRIGRAALIVSIISSITAGALDVAILNTVSGPVRAGSLVSNMALVLVFPILRLLSAVGYLVAIGFWLVPAINSVPGQGRIVRLLRVSAAAAFAYAVADTAFTVFRTIFPPQALGGHGPSLPGTSAVKILHWLLLWLGIPLAFWFWSVISLLSRRYAPTWRRQAIIIALAWPACMALQLWTDYLRFWILHRFSHANPSWLHAADRSFVDVSSGLIGVSLFLGFVSIWMLSAFRMPVGGAGEKTHRVADAP